MLRINLQPPLGIVLLDAGARKNALSPDLVKELARQMRAFEEDPQIKVILLGSTTSDVFSAGVDVQFIAHTDPEVFQASDTLGEMSDWRILDHLTKPVIAIVQGYCLGGGLELALMADIMMMSTNATLGFPEIKLGLMPGLGGTQRLAHVIGPQRAALWILSGRMVTASDAFSMGVGSCLIENDRVWDEAKDLGRTIASYESEALRAAKTALRFSQQNGLAEGLQEETRAFYHLLKTPGAQRRLQTFLEK